jgi:probable biosynthetic protein (TIGR04098 family)
VTIDVNMPQMAAGGLSENWLFKHCGDLHWRELCRAMATTSSELCSEGGERLYPSFVAISARYTAALATLGENDRLDESIRCLRYGSSFFHGVASLSRPGVRLELEMLTAFVSRTAPGMNALRKATPAARFPYRGETLVVQPELLGRSAQLRKRSLEEHRVGSHSFPLDRRTPLGELTYQPSPYVDFNGANLLYYAAYPSICDAGERLLVRAHALLPEIRD